MIEIHNISKDPQQIVMQMTDRGEVLCTAEATLKQDVATLITLADELPMMRFDMGKALLNAIDLAGVQQVACSLQQLQPTLTALGFQLEEDGMFRLDLNGYFTPKCSHEG